MVTKKILSGYGKHFFEPLFIGSGNLFSSIIGAIFWLLVASIVTADEYGALNYYLAIATLASSLSLIGFNSVSITQLAKGNEKILHQANLIVLMVSSISAIAIVLTVHHLSAALLLLGASTFAMTSAEFLGRKQYKRYSLLLIVNRTLQLSISLALYYIIGIDGIILGYALVSLTLSYPFFSSLKLTSFSFSEIRPKIRLAMHSYSVFASQSIAVNADKLLIAPLFGFATLGFYQFGFQFLMFIWVVPGSLYQYLLPQEASRTERKMVKRIGLVASIALAIIMFITIPYVTDLFFPQYHEAIPAAQIMVFGIIPITVNVLIDAKLLGVEKSKPLLAAAIVYTIAVVSMLYLLGNSFGLVGMAASIVVSLSLQSLVLWLGSKFVLIEEKDRNQSNPDIL